jgi:hypothetical protein
MRALRYRGAFLALVAVLVVSSSAFAATNLLNFTGFDWFWPNDIGEGAGSCYGASGEITSVNPAYLTFDYGVNQYTFNWDYACEASADTFGTTAVYTYMGGAGFDVYCDSIATGTAFDYGINPPNATAPSTFTDGDNVLGGSWDGPITLVLDLTDGSGSMNATLTWNRGSMLGDIPAECRTMSLTLAGVSFDPGATGWPEGYHWQITGQMLLDCQTPVENETWGGIKTRFGGDR